MLSLFLSVTLLLQCAQGVPKSNSPPLRNVVALVNSTVDLTCDTIPPDIHDEVILVLWFRENVGTPIFSADARDVSLAQAGVWFDDEILQKRASFRGRISEPSILSIRDINLGDQAVYRCRVDFREAKSRNGRLNLTVIEPPKSLEIESESKMKVGKRVGPFHIGDAPRFTCIVQGGIPRPVVKWRRNRVTVEEGVHVELEGQGSPGYQIKSTLTLPALKRSDWPMTLSCSATNSDRGRPLQHQFDVDMELAPVSASIVVGDRNPTAGEMTFLPCHVRGSHPTPKITWWRHGSPLDPTVYHQTLTINGSLTISSLNITLMKSDLGSRVTCRAVNPQLTSSTLEDTWTVDLSYAPNVTLAMGRSLNAEGIKSGDDVYFDCHVDARPSASRIEWARNGIKLVHNTSANIIMTNQSLVLQNVARSMAGNISCIAYNELGQSHSNSIYLNIKYPPVCKPGLTRYFGVSRAENVEINCQVEANPQEGLKYKWYFNNSAETIEVPTSRYNSSGGATTGGASVLTYKPLASLDYGTLLCYASNSAGLQAEPCVFHILTAGPPESVFNCTTSNQSNDAILITCQPGFHGGLPQNFSLNFYEENSSKLGIQQQLLAEPTFLLSRLKTNMRYKAVITSVNAKGKSEDVILDISTQKEPERQLEVKPEPRPISSMLTPTLGILSAVVMLLCIGGVVSVVLLRRQCQREETRDAGGGSLRGTSRNNSSTNTADVTNSSSTNTMRKTRNGNPSRSQSLKPLMENVNESGSSGNLGSQLLAVTYRMEPDRWKDHLLHHSSTTHHLSSLDLAWPVGEPPPPPGVGLPPPPSTPPPPPPPILLASSSKGIEPGLITPPYTTDSSLDLRSPDIIPPPSIGACDFGPATLPRSYKGFGMTGTDMNPHKPHVTWSDAPGVPSSGTKSFRQSHEFLRSDISNGNGPSKRESVV